MLVHYVSSAPMTVARQQEIIMFSCRSDVIKFRLEDSWEGRLKAHNKVQTSTGQAMHV